MTFRGRLLASFLMGAAVSGARAAHADPAAAELVAAKRAFESAASLESQQHWSEAELKLREAVIIKDTPGLRYHLAHCLSEQGRLLEAELEYDRANELLQQGAKAPDVQKLLAPAAEALKRRIPRLTVELPAGLRAPAVSLDGKVYALSEVGLGLPLNPGAHALRVTAAGHQAFEQSLFLKEGEPLSIRVELAPSAPSAPGRVADPAAHSSPKSNVSSEPPAAAHKPSSTKLYLMIGESVLTAAGLAVGLGFGASRSSAADRVDHAQTRVDQDPGNTRNCATPDSATLAAACTDLRAAIRDHDRAALLSNVGFIGAGVGAAALLTTWLAFPRGRRDASKWHVQPVAGLGQVGLFGRF